MRYHQANLTRTNLAGAKFIDPIQLDGVVGLESFPKGSVDTIGKLGTVVIFSGWLTYGALLRAPVLRSGREQPWCVLRAGDRLTTPGRA